MRSRSTFGAVRLAALAVLGLAAAASRAAPASGTGPRDAAAPMLLAQDIDQGPPTPSPVPKPKPAPKPRAKPPAAKPKPAPPAAAGPGGAPPAAPPSPVAGGPPGQPPTGAPPAQPAPPAPGGAQPAPAQPAPPAPAPQAPAAPGALPTGELQPVVHAQNAKVTTCMDNILAQSASVIDTAHTAISTWVTAAPNDNAFQSIVGLTYPNKGAPNAAAVIFAAPLGPNKCQGQSVQVYPVAQPCSALQAALVKEDGRTLGTLQAIPLVQTKTGVRDLLLPTAGGGCVIVAIGVR